MLHVARTSIAEPALAMERGSPESTPARPTIDRRDPAAMHRPPIAKVDAAMHVELTPEMAAAAQLMEQQRFEESAAAYERVVQTQPAQASLAAMQVGVAQFFLGRYELAVQWYEYAGRLGYNPQEVAEHIAEARQAVAGVDQGGSAPRIQFAFPEDGSVHINENGSGWRPLTHPRPGEDILMEDGSMWKLDPQRGWVPTTQGATMAPHPGAAVFAVLINRFFILQADGSWTLRAD